MTREELLKESMATIEKMTDEEAQAATLVAAGMMAGYEIGRMSALAVGAQQFTFSAIIARLPPQAHTLYQPYSRKRAADRPLTCTARPPQADVQTNERRPPQCRPRNPSA